MSQKDLLLAILHEAKGESRQSDLFEIEQATTGSETKSTPFTFIDLFSGIGGFRMGLESVGGRCLFSSEWDKYAQKTYLARFGEVPVGDIREIDPHSIPDHDLLAAGFPC